MENEGLFKHASMSPNLHSLTLNHCSFTPYNILFRNLPAQRSPNSSPSSMVSQPHNDNPVGATVIRCVLRLIAESVLAPIERVHILMQCQNAMMKSGSLSTPYKGAKDCLLRTIKHEGVLSLWRGNSVNFIKTLTSNETYQIPLLPSINYMLYQPYHHQLNYARTRLATDVKFSGVFDVYKKTLQSDGINGLFRGYTMAYTGSIVLFLVREEIKNYRQAKEHKKERITLKEAATMLFIFDTGVHMLTYPFHTVSRRMMMTSCETTKFSDPIDAVRQIIKHEGVISLYKGIAPCFIYRTASMCAALAISKTLNSVNIDFKLGK